MYNDDEEPTQNHIDEEPEEATEEVPVRNCKSPAEGSYGDDESKDEEDTEEPRVRRRSRRNVRVEEGNENNPPATKTRNRYSWQSSSEDEVARTSQRTSSTTNATSTAPFRRVPSSSSDDGTIGRRKPSLSRTSVRDRKISFEQASSGSENPTSNKRLLLSSKRSNTIATTSQVEERRDSFKKRTASIEGETSSPRRLSQQQKQSFDRPNWSDSTRIQHERVATHTMSRKESTTQSESDEPKSASQLKAKFERKASQDQGINKTKAFGGQTGAAALKARFENQPSAYRRRRTSSSGKIRTFSTDSEDGPTRKVSTTALLARFEAKAAEQAPVKRNFVINKNRTSSAAKKFQIGVPATNKCSVCCKTVYPMEKIEADGLLFHKFCFKCSTCNRTVGLGNYAALQGKIYCKPHLKQLFKLKGNYDEGFGREQRKTDWLKKENAAVSSNQSTESMNGHIDEEVTVNGNED